MVGDGGGNAGGVVGAAVVVRGCNGWIPRVRLRGPWRAEGWREREEDRGLNRGSVGSEGFVGGDWGFRRCCGWLNMMLLAILGMGRVGQAAVMVDAVLIGSVSVVARSLAKQMRRRCAGYIAVASLWMIMLAVLLGWNSDCCACCDTRHNNAAHEFCPELLFTTTMLAMLGTMTFMNISPFWSSNMPKWAAGL